MKRLLLTLLLLLTFAPTLDMGAAAAPKPPKVTQSIFPLQIATISPHSGEPVMQNTCTTSSINAVQHLWLTAGHCISNEAKTAINTDAFYFINGFPAIILAADFAKDLAILYTPDTSAPALKVSSHAPTYKDSVTIWGHPFGISDIIAFTGHVATPSYHYFDRTFILMTAVVAPGNSGSPVLDHDDKIITVALFGTSDSFSVISGGINFESFKAFVTPFLP